MANMPDRPQSLQDRLAEQTRRNRNSANEQRRLARHICSFVDRTGYLGTREKMREDDDRDAFCPVTLGRGRGPRYDEVVTEELIEDTLIHVVQRLWNHQASEPAI